MRSTNATRRYLALAVTSTVILTVTIILSLSHIIAENNNVEISKLLESLHDGLHWLGLGLLIHRAHTDHNFPLVDVDCSSSHLIRVRVTVRVRVRLVDIVW